jgi:putative ABC transport system permease protein
MGLVFLDQRAEARAKGGVRLARLWLRTALGILTTAPGEHLDALRQDARFASRLMRREIGFTIVSVLTLAVGVGAFTALLALAYGVLWKPLPFEAPENLVRLWDTNPESGIEKIGVTTGNLVDWRRRNRTLEGVAGWYAMGRTLRTHEEAEVVVTAQVTADFFPLLRVRPLLGRLFTEAESEHAWFDSAAGFTGTEPVVILSHRLWRQRFGGSPDVVGKELDLERRPFRVVGVMPPDFRFPGPEVDLWIPWGLVKADETTPRDQHYVQGIARLGSGVGLERAEADMQALASALAQEYPETNRGWSVRLVPLHEDLVSGARLALTVLTAAVGVLFFVAALNAAGLELVRATGRRQEAALRAALGASAGRLTRQQLVEGLLSSGVAGALGFGFAWAGIQLLKAAPPTGIPRLEEVEIGATAAGVALALAALAGLLLAAAPALALGKLRVTESLRSAGRAAHGRQVQRFRSGLVVAQVATAVVLLLGAGLLGRSFARLMAVDPGFDARNVLVLPIFLEKNSYRSGAPVRAYYDELMERLAAIPGVVSVGGATALPASPLGPDFERPVWREEASVDPASKRQADVRIVTSDYFRTLGITVLRGRGFSATDAPDAPPVVCVNEKLAREVWGDEDPVGRRLMVDYSTAGTYAYEVIGVVGNVRFYGLRSAPRPEIFLAHAQRSYLVLNVAVRTASDPVPFIGAVRGAMRDVDAGQPPAGITPLADLVSATVERDRFATHLLTSLAVLGLSLAVLGLSGLMAFRVRQRTAEIGVRMALGAGRRAILRMVMAQGVRLTAAGITLGLLIAVPASRLLRGLLYGIQPHDVETYVVATALLAAVALVACWLPARRAVRVDPSVALRCE